MAVTDPCQMCQLLIRFGPEQMLIEYRVPRNILIVDRENRQPRKKKQKLVHITSFVERTAHVDGNKKELA